MPTLVNIHCLLLALNACPVVPLSHPIPPPNRRCPRCQTAGGRQAGAVPSLRHVDDAGAPVHPEAGFPAVHGAAHQGDEAAGAGVPQEAEEQASRRGGCGGGAPRQVLRGGGGARSGARRGRGRGRGGGRGGGGGASGPRNGHVNIGRTLVSLGGGGCGRMGGRARAVARPCNRAPERCTVHGSG